MKNSSIVLTVFLALLSACAGRTTSSSEPSASPSFTAQSKCERESGVWHTNLGICEVPAPPPQGRRKPDLLCSRVRSGDGGLRTGGRRQFGKKPARSDGVTLPS